jgi:hypothetical protein
MMNDEEKIVRARIVGVRANAAHVRALQGMTAEIAAAEAAYQGACQDEDAAVRRYDDGDIELAELEAVAAKREAAWKTYKALCDEGERLLAVGKKD